MPFGLPLATGNRIDLVEPYAVRQARQAIKNSLQSHGEECILLHMFHVNEVGPDVQRCPQCFDDLYKDGDKFDCPRCFGTTFDGGVRDAYRGWAIFTDSQDEETVSRQGVWHPIARSMHTEWQPDLWQRDYVIRVAEWSLDHRPVSIEGIYVMKEVQNESLRTGNYAGQTSVDNVGQRCDLDRVAEEMPIWRYQVVNQRFDRWDGAAR